MSTNDDKRNHASEVFVWHDQQTVHGSHVDDSPISMRCPYCGSKYNFRSIVPEFPAYDDDDDCYEQHTECRCKVCGFWYVKHLAVEPMAIHSNLSLEVAILKKLNINDSELGFTELGAHLKGRFRDIYALSPRRFEQLVADIYSNMGYHVHLTQQTRDGGYDILLLEKHGRGKIIVECKRYAKNRKITVNIVREILGVQLLTEARRAKIVATTEFTNPAKKAALAAANSAYELDLVDAERIARALDVYNADASSLAKLEFIGRQAPLDLGLLHQTVLIKRQAGP